MCIPDIVTGHLRLYFVGVKQGERLDLNYGIFPANGLDTQILI